MVIPMRNLILSNDLLQQLLKEREHSGAPLKAEKIAKSASFDGCSKLFMKRGSLTTKMWQLVRNSALFSLVLFHSLN